MSRRPAGLIALARAYGIHPHYRSFQGERRSASTESLVAALRVLGAPVDGVADVRDALRERRELAEQPGLDAVHVAWGGDLPGLRFRAPAGVDRVRIRVRLEDGDSRAVVAPVRPRTPRSNREWPLHLIDIGGRLPLGYHTLELEAAGRSYRTHLISTPKLAHDEPGLRAWGVFMPLYAFGRPELGAGTYAELREAARWIADRGGSFLGTLPLLASFLDAPFEPSPYAPVSRLFWNDLFIDLRELPVAVPEPPPLAGGDLVDYRAVAAARLPALRAAAARFYDAGGARDPELRRFADRTPRLDDYARFRAACDRFRSGWQSWPAAARDGTLADGDIDPTDAAYHRFAAWAADAQMARVGGDAGAALYLDLPLGVHPDGYDVWRERELFALDASAGAPPDALFVRGQNWGFPPLIPGALRATGYQYYVECLRHHLRHAGLLRLDHVMALQRLYWIPRGLPATEGVYVQYPQDELVAVLAIESTRHRTAVIGEDLGTVSREIRTAMKRHAVHRMYVVQYEADSDRDPPLNPVPASAIASLNTHDMPPFAAFWSGLDLDDQRDLDLLDAQQESAARADRAALRRRIAAAFDTPDGVDRDATAAALLALLRHLGASTARYVLVNLEDLWLETRPQNVPGTSSERPNWRRRARYSIQSLIREPGTTSALDELDRIRRTASPRTRRREKSHG